MTSPPIETLMAQMNECVIVVGVVVVVITFSCVFVLCLAVRVVSWLAGCRSE